MQIRDGDCRFAAGAAPVEKGQADAPMAEVVETVCAVMTKAGGRIDQLIARADVLAAERADLLRAVGSLTVALENYRGRLTSVHLLMAREMDIDIGRGRAAIAKAEGR